MARLTQDEKGTTEYLSHRLEIRRIWLEKVLLFLIIGGITGGITFLGKVYLETYKSDLIVKEYLLKSKLEGIKEISQAYSKLVEHLFSLPIDGKDKMTKYCAKYKTSLFSYMNICNRWNSLLTEEFENNLQYHYYIHEAIACNKVDINHEHYNFLSAVIQHFDKTLSRELVNILKSVPETKKYTDQWDFIYTSKKTFRKMKAEEFFKVNYDKWRNENP